MASLHTAYCLPPTVTTMEWFAGIFVFIAVIAVTAVLFGLWLVMVVVRLCVSLLIGVCRMIGRFWNVMIYQDSRPLAGQAAECSNVLCKALNPSEARFCRRCGRDLSVPAQQVSVRRAAMW
jgi:hypothetical protein